MVVKSLHTTDFSPYCITLPPVLWHCWLDVRKSIRPVNNWVMRCWREMQMICTWSCWCHCHPIISCCIKIQIGLTFLMPAYPGCSGKETVKQMHNFVHAVIIRPLCSTTFVSDIAIFVLKRDVKLQLTNLQYYIDWPVIERIAWSVCWLVGHSREPCKNDWTDWNTVWVMNLGGPSKPCISWGPDLSMQRGNFAGVKWWPIIKYRDSLP